MVNHKNITIKMAFQVSYYSTDRLFHERFFFPLFALYRSKKKKKSEVDILQQQRFVCLLIDKGSSHLK